jgi:hypothetical protein
MSTLMPRFKHKNIEHNTDDGEMKPILSASSPEAQCPSNYFGVC